MERSRSPLRWLREHKQDLIRWVVASLIVVALLAGLIEPIGQFFKDREFFGYVLFLAIAYAILDALGDQAASSDAEFVELPHNSDLLGYLEECAQTGELSVDFVGYSSETFYNVMSGILGDVVSGEVRLRRLRLRMLVPDVRYVNSIPADIHTGLPVQAAVDEAEQRCITYMQRFAAYGTSIHDAGVVEDLLIETRLHNFSPLFKMLLVNDRFVFYSHYPILQSRKTWGTVHADVWDYRGSRSIFTMFDLRRGGHPASLLTSLVEWFAVVWDHLSHELQAGDL